MLPAHRHKTRGLSNLMAAQGVLMPVVCRFSLCAYCKYFLDKYDKSIKHFPPYEW